MAVVFAAQIFVTVFAVCCAIGYAWIELADS